MRFLDRWRAQRALLTRTAPNPAGGQADERLLAVLESLRRPLGAVNSLGDPLWHARWEGELQLVGLDARTRATGDVRQRLTRLVHEMDLRHVGARARRVVAVLLCDPGDGGLRAWLERLFEDRGEVGSAWDAVRDRVTVLVLDGHGEHALRSRDDALGAALESVLAR